MSATHDRKTESAILAEDMNADPEFAAEWQRLALARAVAHELIRFRAQHKLTQRDLADVLGVKQPRIVQLESGEHNPQIETLIDISGKTGIEFAIDITPGRAKPGLLTKSAQENSPPHTYKDVTVVVAATKRQAVTV